MRLTHNLFFSIAHDPYRRSSACINQPLPKPPYDGGVMPLQHWYEPKPQYQIVFKGSEDDFSMPDDANSPSITFDEEHEEMRIDGNFACTQDSDSDDTDVSLTPLNSSLNHLILFSQLSTANQQASYTSINKTGTETTKEVGEELATAAECIDKIIMPVS